MAAHLDQWSALQRGVSADWYHAYLLSSGVQNRDIMPDDIYHYVIDPILNRVDSIPFLRQKSLNELIWDRALFPKMLIRRVAGFEYDEHFSLIGEEHWAALLKDHTKVILKPSIHSGGGRDVQILDVKNGKLADRDGQVVTRASIAQAYGDDFVIQALV